MTPFQVKDATCPRCGRATDTCLDDESAPEDAPSFILYCAPCDHSWMNLANLSSVEPDESGVPFTYEGGA